MLPDIDPSIKDVEVSGHPLREGITWTETRRFWGIPRRRTFTVMEFEKGKRLVTACDGATYTWEAKKGGTGSCNLHLRIDGDAAAVARAVKFEGKRLEQIRAFVDD